MTRLPRRWLLGPLFGVGEMGLADVALGVLLSGYAVYLVTGETSGISTAGGRRRWRC